MYLTEKTPTNVVSEIINCYIIFIVVQSLSHVWLCDPMDCSTSGFPVLHHLLEFIQSHIQWVRDATQPSHPVFSFSSCLQSLSTSGSFPMSWLFASGGQSTEASASASVLLMNTGVGNGNPLQYSCLENPMDRGLWQATVHEVAKSQTPLNDGAHRSLLLPYSDAKLLVLLFFWSFIFRLFSCPVSAP